MNEMRRLINLVESAQQEQLDEFDLKKAATTAMAVGALAGGVDANDITYDDLFNKYYTAEIEKMEQQGRNLTDRNADGYNPSLKRGAKKIAELKAKQEYLKLSIADSPVAKEIEKTRTELPQSEPKPDLPQPDINKYIPSNMGKP